MKKLPEVNVSFEDLYRMLVAPIRSKLLLTGIELKVFNHLSELRSAEAVAEAIGTHQENTRLFLDGLAASDLVVKSDGLYQNTPVSQAFLVEESPTYLGLVFADQFQMNHPVLNDLVLASDNLYYDKDETDLIVKKVYDALNPSGVFVSFHGCLTHERTGPDMMVLGMILDDLMGQGRMIDQGFIADSMLRAGFKSVQSRTLDTDWGPMDLDVGRKA